MGLCLSVYLIFKFILYIVIDCIIQIVKSSELPSIVLVKIGNLNSLQTTNKSSLVSAVNEVRNLAQQAKNGTPTACAGSLVSSEADGYDYDFTPEGSFVMRTGDHLVDEANSSDEFTILAFVDGKYYIATANGIESVRILEFEPEPEEEEEEPIEEEIEEQPEEEEPPQEEP